jgi:hypothetical protein
MRLRLNVIGTGADSDPYRVNLPEYQLVPGSELPVGALALKNAANVTVNVDVPNRLLHKKTKNISAPRIQALYAGNDVWDKGLDPVALAASLGVVVEQQEQV